MIISNGGDPITALRIISILRERFNKISVLLPCVAYSAATILSLGADEIIVHPYSNLGPADPQLTISRHADNGQASQLQFSSEDIRNYIDFVKTDVGITDQVHLTSAFNALAKGVGPLPIGSAKRSQQLSLSLSTKMSETHMADKSKAASIAKALNTSYYNERIRQDCPADDPVAFYNKLLDYVFEFAKANQKLIRSPSGRTALCCCSISCPSR